MRYYKFSIDIVLLNVLVIILFIPLFLLISFLNLWDYFDLYFVLYYLLWMAFHELFHGIGFKVTGVDSKNIVYGISLEKGIMWCMCKHVISKKSIMISLLFPFLFIGVFTFFIGLFINSSTLVLLSLFNIISSIGDLAMFFSFLNLPDFNYVDLDDPSGFVLMSCNDLRKYKLFGISFVECSDKVDKALNYSKFTVSKLSKVLFIVFVILILFINWCV